MNILFLAAECAPYVKAGGLGDVVGALPQALADLGHSVRVVAPHHGSINDKRHDLRACSRFKLSWNKHITTVKVACASRGDVITYFVRGWPYFSPDEKFIYSDDEGIDIGRFLFFSAAALKLARRLAERENWRPDLLHAHDWHMGGVPYLAARPLADDPVIGDLPTTLTIHNMQYQGWGVDWHLAQAGLPPVDHPLVAAMGKSDCLLAAGLAYSTTLSTVSPRYAQEITTPVGGYGLEGLTHARQANLVGILNGIDDQRWNPATSGNLAAVYDAKTLTERAENKRALQAEMGLPQAADAPLLGTVTRLVDQKGPEILLGAVRRVLAGGRAQFVLLGAGQKEHEQSALALASDFPESAAVRLVFDEALAERIYAGIDLFLMPSIFEPCGVGQMLAMRYGALPVVRETGGLADTVSPATGFLFSVPSAAALSAALDRALDVYHHNKSEWRARQRRAMRIDFGWGRSAEAYSALYEKTIALHRKYKH